MTVRIEGRGLHSGCAASVTFHASDGPLRLRRRMGANWVEVNLDAFRVIDTVRSTTIASHDGAFRVATVEHLFAALAGLGIYDGLELTLEGPELPLVDGGASSFVRAAREAGARASSVRLRVVEDGVVEVGDSTYAFVRAEGSAVEAHVSFGDARFDGMARWDGAADDFADRIAPARTFSFEHELMELLAKGLASHVAPESVVVLCKDRVLSAGPPFRPDEPARHKLLDLIGDLFVYGGPPRGLVRALRPGHAATHEAMKRALAMGLVRRQ